MTPDVWRKCTKCQMLNYCKHWPCRLQAVVVLFIVDTNMWSQHVMPTYPLHAYICCLFVEHATVSDDSTFVRLSIDRKLPFIRSRLKGSWTLSYCRLATQLVHRLTTQLSQTLRLSQTGRATEQLCRPSCQTKRNSTACRVSPHKQTAQSWWTLSSSD